MWLVTFVFDGLCVGVSGSLSSLPTKESIEAWANLVLASFYSVALGAPLNKQLLALGNISSRYRHCLKKNITIQSKLLINVTQFSILDLK